MKITTFSLEIGETINMGNFNNVKYAVSGTISIEGLNDEDREEAIEKFRQYLRGKAVAQRNSIKGS